MWSVACFMKTNIILKRIISTILLLLMAFSIVGCDSTKFIYTHMLYDSIEYNGVTYYSVPDSDRPENSVITDFNIPVFIVDNENKTRKDRVYYAASIEDDSNYEYLIFDSGTFLRSDLFPLED